MIRWLKNWWAARQEAKRCRAKRLEELKAWFAMPYAQYKTDGLDVATDRLELPFLWGNPLTQEEREELALDLAHVDAYEKFRAEVLKGASAHWNISCDFPLTQEELELIDKAEQYLSQHDVDELLGLIHGADGRALVADLQPAEPPYSEFALSKPRFVSYGALSDWCKGRIR